MKLNIFGLSICLLFLLESLNAQHVNFEWAISEGTTNYDTGTSIVTDASGNVYITGLFHGTVDFDPSGNTFNLTSSSHSHLFIQKLDANGNFLWAKSIGGTSTIVGYSAIDLFGNLYTIGWYEQTIDFDPGSGTFHLTSSGMSDIFIQKLDANGNFLWAKSIGGISVDQGQSVATDGLGNVFITGLYHQTVDFDPSGNSFNLTSVGDLDAFVQKLDANGNFLWAKSMGGMGIDYGTSIKTDGLGNVYLSGIYNDSADFDPSGGVFNLIPKGFFDCFVQKLDANGNFLWAKSVGGTDNDYGEAVVVDSAGSVYLAGGYYGTADFDPSAGVFNLTSNGSEDIFIQKLDANGNFLWAKSLGNSQGEKLRSMALDASGNLYITGNYAGTVDFDPSGEIFNLTSGNPGSYDTFVQKLDANGNFKWAKSTKGTWGVQVESIAVDSFGNVYTTGTHVGKTDFDPSSDTFYFEAAGLYGNIFIQKLSQDAPNTGTDVLTTCEASYIWVDGNTYTSSNNSANFNIIGGAANGSDSLITLDLTMIIVDTNVSLDSNKITANATNATFQWLDCEDNYAPMLGAIYPDFVPVNTSQYAVEVTQDGCVDTSACFLFVVDGLQKTSSLPDAIIYPNPNNGRFSIDLGRPYSDVRLSILDIYGSPLQTSHYHQTQLLELEISQASGLYFAIIVLPDGQKTSKKIILIK